MSIINVNGTSFTKETVTDVSDDVTTLTAQIDTKNHLIAQTILNRTNDTKTLVQSIQNDINAIQSDIDAAVAAGATPVTPTVDVSALITSLNNLATDAAALA